MINPEDTKVLKNLKSVLEKLNMIKVNPCEEMREALETAYYKAYNNFGSPSVLIMHPHVFDQFKNT